MNEQASTDYSQLLIEIKKMEGKFITLVRERLGIIIHNHQQNDFHKIIAEACKKFNYTAQEYYQIISEASDHSPVIEELVTGITIGETYFFRDANQMKLLQETILPELIKQKRQDNNRILRIWSAGSSSGEEIYTIAMMLSDILPDINAWTLNLLGTDINTAALKKAMTGHYGDWSMRSIPERFKQRYFNIMKKQYVLSQSIRDMVTFFYLNLNEDTFPSILNDTNARDLIICRNVLIYFDRERGAHLMKKLSACLTPGGSIMLGASDPVYTNDTYLILKNEHASHFMLRNEDAPVQKQKTITKQVVSIPKMKASSQQISSKTNPNLKTSVAPKTLSSPEEHKEVINKLLSEARWQDALDKINSYQHQIIKSAYLLSASGIALANLGKLNQAADFCYKSLAIDATSIDTHFTLALVLVELNRLKEAEAEFRSTLFLDHQFVMGHFQLGLLLIKNKQIEMGLKCLNNALTIAKSHNPDQLVSGLNKIYYGHLAEILEHEIELHISSRGTLHAVK
jgi:chemotaxis protein methyltransferase CheR